MSIEGEWQGYTFRIAKPSDSFAISNFLSQYYYRDEPITLYLTGWSEAKERDMDAAVTQFITHNLSLIALDSTTPSPTIAGVRIAYDSRRLGDLNTRLVSESNRRVGMAKDQLLELAEERLRAEFPEKYWVMGFLASVAEHHRGRGLAKQLYIRSLRHFAQQGYPLTRNFFSSEVTMGIVRRLGYVELSRLPLNQVKDSEGRLVFPDAAFSAAFMAKRLT